MKLHGFMKIAAIITVSTLLFSLAACSNAKVKTGITTTAGGQEIQATNTQEIKKDPMAKYETPIEVTVAFASDPANTFLEGDSWENNSWTRGYEKELGIKTKVVWTADNKQFDQKVNVCIASDDVPDILRLNVDQTTNMKLFSLLMKSEIIADLTDIYEQYATPLTKDIAMRDGGTNLSAITLKDKLMAIPDCNSSIDGLPVLWVRTDWLTKLNLPEPKTMQDVLKISEAFTKNDPDANGKDDTFGLALQKDLMGGLAGLDGFFAAYHAYPSTWLKDSSGNLVNGAIQPEVKTVLGVLQNMYKAGQIDREFGVKDGGKVAESLTSGQIGMEFGEMWNPLWPLNAGKEKNKDLDWRAYPIPSIDGEVATPACKVGNVAIAVVSKKAKNPEAAIKMVNLFTDKLFSNHPNHEQYGNREGIELHKPAIVQMWPSNKNLENYRAYQGAQATNDTSKFNPEQKLVYDTMLKFINNGDVSGWGYSRVFGKDSSFKIIDQYVTNKSFIINKFHGAPTETMSKKQSILDKMQLEVFTKIIMNTSPVDEFDKFVSNWKNMGGDQIVAEVNKWYSSTK